MTAQADLTLCWAHVRRYLFSSCGSHNFLKILQFPEDKAPHFTVCNPFSNMIIRKQLLCTIFADKSAPTWENVPLDLCVHRLRSACTFLQFDHSLPSALWTAKDSRFHLYFSRGKKKKLTVPDKVHFSTKNCWYFSYFYTKTEALLMSTHNIICFHGVIRKISTIFGWKKLPYLELWVWSDSLLAPRHKVHFLVLCLKREKF